MAGLTIQSLRGYVALVDEGSFSAAAKRLGLTQPAISAQLKALEDHFGIELIDRAGRNWRPTAAGERLYSHARQLTAAAEAMEASITTQWEGLAGRLQIAASTVPGEFLLPKLLGDFCEENPAIQVSVEVSSSSAIVDQLLLRRADIGVVGDEVTAEKLESIPFAGDELLLVAPPGHPLSRSRSIKPDDLVFQPWVMRQRGSGTRNAATRALASAGINAERLPVVLELGSTEAVKRAVKAGVGLSFLSCYCLEPGEAGKHISVLRFPGMKAERRLNLIVGREGSRPGAVQAILDYLTSQKVADRLLEWRRLRLKGFV